MKYLREHLGDIVLGGLLLAAFALVFMSQQPKQQALGAGGNFSTIDYAITATANPYYNHAVATTSESNLVYVGTASSTYAWPVDGIDQVDFIFQIVNGASTTPATTGGYISSTPLDLVYCYDFSNATTAVASTLWFPKSSNCASWNSGVIGTSTLAVAVTNVNSKYMRVHFSSTMSTSTKVGLWAHATLKKGY